MEGRDKLWGWGGGNKRAVVFKQQIMLSILGTRLSSVANVTCHCPRRESTAGYVLWRGHKYRQEGALSGMGKDIKTDVEESIHEDSEDQKGLSLGKRQLKIWRVSPAWGNCIPSKAMEFLGWMRASVGLGVWFSGKWGVGERSHCKAADGQKENKVR